MQNFLKLLYSLGCVELLIVSICKASAAGAVGGAAAGRAAGRAARAAAFSAVLHSRGAGGGLATAAFGTETGPCGAAFGPGASGAAGVLAVSTDTFPSSTILDSASTRFSGPIDFIKSANSCGPDGEAASVGSKLPDAALEGVDNADADASLSLSDLILHMAYG